LRNVRKAEAQLILRMHELRKVLATLSPTTQLILITFNYVHEKMDMHTMNVIGAQQDIPLLYFKQKKRHSLLLMLLNLAVRVYVMCYEITVPLRWNKKFCGHSINNLVKSSFYCARNKISKYSSVIFAAFVRLLVRVEQLDGRTRSSWYIDSELPESVVIGYNRTKTTDTV